MRKHTQKKTIRHAPSYKQLEVNINRTPFLGRSRSEHPNRELRT